VTRQIDGQNVEVLREFGEQRGEVVTGGADAVQQQERLAVAGAVGCEERHVTRSVESSPAHPRTAGASGHIAASG
jgi:hypothetical protein